MQRMPQRLPEMYPGGVVSEPLWFVEHQDDESDEFWDSFVNG